MIPVTFMIATRNRLVELEKTLAACLAQDGPAVEILVVDDASTDGTQTKAFTVVGAGSVVTKDVPADAVVVGEPARLVRIRPGSNTQQCGP